MLHYRWSLSFVVMLLFGVLYAHPLAADETGDPCDCGTPEAGYTNFETYNGTCRIWYDHEYQVCNGVIYVRITAIWLDPTCPSIPQSEICDIVCASIEILAPMEVQLWCNESLTDVDVSFAAGTGCSSCP